MTNVHKLLAAVAISACMAVSASAFAADANTTAAATKPAVHKHHHKVVHHHKAVHHVMCKKNKKGHCMHNHHMTMAPAHHEAWMGTPAPAPYHPHD